MKASFALQNSSISHFSLLHFFVPFNFGLYIFLSVFTRTYESLKHFHMNPSPIIGRGCQGDEDKTYCFFIVNSTFCIPRFSFVLLLLTFLMFIREYNLVI